MLPPQSMTRVKEMHEAIILNRQKGDPFHIKFWGDPIVYEGIPVMGSGTQIEAERAFQFEITAPEEVKGLRTIRLEDVQSMELRTDFERRR